MAGRSEDDYTPLQAELFEVWEGLATIRGVALTHSTPHPDHGHLCDLGKLLQRDISNIIDKIGALEARAEAAEQRVQELETALRSLVDQWFSGLSPATKWTDLGTGDRCMYCDAQLRPGIEYDTRIPFTHKENCPITQARRLLGGE